MTDRQLLKPVSPDFYNNYSLDLHQIESLEGCAGQVREFQIRTIEGIVAVGSSLIAAREVLGKSRNNKTKGQKTGTFMSWVRERICQPYGLSYDTIARWMAVAEQVQKNPNKVEAMSAVSTSALYELVKSSFPEDLRQAVLAAEPETLVNLTTEQVSRIKKLSQSIQAQERGVDPQAIIELSKTDTQIAPNKLRTLSKLNPQEQVRIAQTIVNDRDLGFLELRKAKEHQKTSDVTIVETQAGFKSSIVELDNILPESLDLILVECPYGRDWKNSYLSLEQLDKTLAEILRPSGFAIVFMGHVSILYSGSRFQHLNPLHLLTIRRMPGNSTINTGVNLGFASVHAVLLYKPPFNSTKEALFDLQTIKEQELPSNNFAEIESGIESGIDKFLAILVRPTDDVAHLALSQRTFGLTEHIQQTVKTLKANSFTKIC